MNDLIEVIGHFHLTQDDDSVKSFMKDRDVAMETARK
jgi:hypothetical protein